MTQVAATAAAAAAISRVVPELVERGVAGAIMAQDPTLWGEAAAEESAKRLGWVEAPHVTLPLLEEIEQLRDSLREAGVTRIALAGMGGSSLAPEVIAATYGVPLTVLDSTEPGQVLDALRQDLAATAIVVSSKSGSTVETDSQRRVFDQWFREAGIDPAERIIVVTDPGSPLDIQARADGLRVFNADPNVGGRFSALTAFGIVPAGLAGVDVRELIDEAIAVLPSLTEDAVENPGLQLGAVLAGTLPLRDKIGIVSDGTHIVGLGDWAEQLIAESTGKEGKGLLPIALGTDAHEVSAELHDVQIIRLVGSPRDLDEVREGEVEVVGSLGGQFMTWSFAVAVAGHILGINPFDQPDVESAKSAARELLDQLGDEQMDAAPADALLLSPRGFDAGEDLRSALDALFAAIPENGYLAIHAYLNRNEAADYAQLRDAVAARTARPATFGWGPRFLHSTGQYHKGGVPSGVFLQIVDRPAEDLEIPGRPFTFGQLIAAQAQGDATVLANQGRPVLTISVGDAAAALATIHAAIEKR